MKVLHVIDSLGGSGGAEHGMVREVARLPAAWDQLVIRLFEKDHLDQYLVRSGLSVRSLGLKAANAGKNWPYAILLLRRIITEFRPNVIHSSLFSANLVAQLAGRSTGIPTVSTFTLSGDIDLLRSHQPGAASIRAGVLRGAARVAAAPSSVVFRALTNDALETNCRLLGVDAGRCRVIPRGLPPDLRPEIVKPRAELGIPETGPILVNVGRQTAQKGQGVLIEALGLLLKERLAHLVIVGREGDASSALKTQVDEAGLIDRVTFTGYTPDVFHYLSHAAVFVFPSFMEGLGTAVLEAMRFELPVVAFDIPPVREITDGGRLARLVTPGDAPGLAEALLRALDQDDAGTRAEARDWVITNFAIDVVVDRLAALLQEAATSG